MIKQIILPFLFAIRATFILGQTTDPTNLLVPNPIPPSPNAASLGKYGNIPVSKYTGVVDISIPIWQINEGDITVPISLSYHASGVKVEENASWVGLGWALNAGGVITRSVRGKPDELGYILNSVVGSARTSNLIPDLLLNIVGSNASYCDAIDATNYCHEVVEGPFDSEPDVYFFNFNGISGKFVLDQQGNAYTIPFQKIKIEKLTKDGWKITTPDGMQYTFNVAEKTTNSSVAYNVFGGVTGDNISNIPTFTSSWYLSSIQSTSGHFVTFNYTPENYNTHSGQSQYVMWDISSSTNFNANNNVVTTGSLSQINGQRLTNIVFSNGRVDFTATKTREDLDYYPQTNPNLLEKISISNNSGFIRHFVLGTDYFTSNDANQNCDTKRLRLNSITEWSGDMSASKPPYLFSYDNTGAFPSKISSSQDDWGFYNGKTNLDINNNPTLIPNTETGLINTQQFYYSEKEVISVNDPTVNLYSDGVDLLSYKGADRTPDFNFTKIGILNKVTYPSGGYTNYEYEPNDYDLKPGNYTYKANQQILQSSATSAPGASLPDNVIVHEFNDSYTNTKTFDLTQFINSSNSSVNQTVSANLTFSFGNGGQIFYNCGFTEPEALFIDVTANKTLIDIFGRAGIPPAYFDQSIQNQINLHTLTLSGDFNYVYLPGNEQDWKSFPDFYFTNLQLDPTHVYQLKTITYLGVANSCDAGNGVTRPTDDIYTNAALRLECSINTSTVAQYNGIVGGLRVKKISDFSNVNQPVVKQYIEVV